MTKSIRFAAYGCFFSGFFVAVFPAANAQIVRLAPLSSVNSGASTAVIESADGAAKRHPLHGATAEVRHFLGLCGRESKKHCIRLLSAEDARNVLFQQALTACRDYNDSIDSFCRAASENSPFSPEVRTASVRQTEAEKNFFSVFQKLNDQR